MSVCASDAHLHVDYFTFFTLQCAGRTLDLMIMTKTVITRQTLTVVFSRRVWELWETDRSSPEIYAVLTCIRTNAYSYIESRFRLKDLLELS